MLLGNLDLLGKADAARCAVLNGGALGADAGVIVVVVIIALVIALAVRSINKASMKRLERGTGPETPQDRKRKQDERADAKNQAAARAKADEREQAERADGPLRRKAPGRGPKKLPKGKGRKGEPVRRAPAPADPEDADLLDAELEEEEQEAVAPEHEPPGLLLPAGKPLGEGLLKTRRDGFVGRLGRLFKGREVDAQLIDQIEEVLFTADIGVRTSQKLLDGMREKLGRKELDDTSLMWKHLRDEAEQILGSAGEPRSLRIETRDEPYVVLVIGVNGSGKTTTIGKLGCRIAAGGKKVMFGAGDTFRAAAVEQLEIWARRVGAAFHRGKDQADPAAVSFDAVQRARQEKCDVLLLDTAGRLHTNEALVRELQKVKRTVSKAQEGAPHEVLLVLDGTQGQTAIAQAHTFTEALGVTGFVLTKLDGTAKGGVILGICDELRIPLCWVGIGERTEDLRPFDRHEFVTALFEAADSAEARAEPEAWGTGQRS